MQLLCPHCGFSREIPAAPTAGAAPVLVLCPACNQTFSVTPQDTTTPPAATAERGTREEAMAGFWIRFCAALLDGLLVATIQGLILFLFGALLALLLDDFDGEGLLMVGLGWLLASSIGMIYYVFFTGYGGQTPGKMALRIKVIRCDGSEIGLGRAFYRETLCKFVAGIIFGIGYLMVAFDARKQGLHDRMADTYVIRL